MPVSEFWSLSPQRRANVDRIPVPQMNPAYATVAVKQSIRGVEILKSELSIAGALLLKDGVNSAETQLSQWKFTGRVPSQSVSRIF